MVARIARTVILLKSGNSPHLISMHLPPPTSSTASSLHPEKESTIFILLISATAAIGGFLFGYDSGVINGTVDGLKAAFHSDSLMTGFNVASTLLGCAAGAFLAGNLADKYGRRLILIISALLFAVSALGAGISHTSLEFIFYRILGGFAVGAASVLCPAYISEVTPARYRGAMSSLQQVAIISGLFFSFLSNYFIAKIAGTSLGIFAWGLPAWRWMFWIQLIPSLSFFLALLFIPESPRYLLSAGKVEQARQVLIKLFGKLAANEKIREIDATISHEHRPKFSDLFSAGGIFGLRPIVWVGIGLAVLQQFVGINVVFYYGSVLWQSAGFTESDSLLINVLSGGVSIAACIGTILLIDRIGRKPLLLIGSIGMAVTLGTMAVVFTTAGKNAAGSLHLVGSAGPIALVAANLYVIFFNLSWGPVMWVMLGEMFPNQIRGSALAVSGLAQWLANFIITITFPMLLSGIGLGGAYGFYTFFALLSILFVLKMVHETKGMELEQMKG
jgi:SP family sugar:H+ symporter-like MFS transporter